MARQDIAASFPKIGGEGWKGILVVGSILFVALIPFFAYREVARVLGKDELHSLIFKRGAETDATQVMEEQFREHLRRFNDLGRRYPRR